MKVGYLIFYFLISSFVYSQTPINVFPISEPPQEFKDRYYSKKRDWNPLHVGNVWQYFFQNEFGGSSWYVTTEVVKDSIINGKKYFKKISLQVDFRPQTKNFISWERNDTLSGNSFMLDFQDVNENGDTLEELPLDSLELPMFSFYETYKYSYFNDFRFFPGLKTSYILKDSTWVVFSGDTVLYKSQEVLEVFMIENIIESIGLVSYTQEGPSVYLSGAIINGKQYGTIVSVENQKEELLSEYNLGNNYPNPFNPVTKIKYTIQNDVPLSGGDERGGLVKLEVFGILGNRITTLVNQNQPPGVYEVEFDGSNIPSGVYLYKLTAGSFTETKKMILLK